MNLLVCGGAGFIGSTFILNHLKNNIDDKIINLDNLSLGSNLDNLHSLKNNQNYSFVKEDIRNFDKVKQYVKDVDVIINFAAESHVDRSISNPLPFIETNIVGTYSLLEAARLNDKFFVQVSTDEVYGEAENNKSFTEDELLNPRNPYAATKSSADNLVKSYHHTYGIKCIITRCTNNFGPYQFPEKLIPKTIIRLDKNLPIPLHGGGHQIRSWISVLDHVKALETVIQNGTTGEIYNVSDSNELQVRTIVEKILKIMNKPLNMTQEVTDRPGQDKRYSINSSKIRSLGWKPTQLFDESLRETVKWYLNNRNWWEPIVDKNILHPTPWILDW